MLAAVAAFSVMDTAMKVLAASYPPLEVACLRGLSSIPFFLIGVAVSRAWRQLLPVRWGEHLFRGVLAIGMLWTFVYAVSKLPLASAYGIFLCAPLLITALSAIVLHESVGLHRWAAIVSGLAGVVIILNPSHKDIVTIAGLAAFASAVCYAISALMIRRLARTDSTLSISMSFVVLVAIGTGIAAWPHWIAVHGVRDWLWIAALGSSGAVGQYLIIYAFRSASASAISPLEFSALLWGIGIDWVMFSTVPTARMLTGAAVVIASGLYLIYREARSGAAVVAAGAIDPF